MNETSWAIVQQTVKPSGWRTVRLGEAIEVNPRRALTQGTEAPFVAMSNMLEHHRLIPTLDTRKYRGGGSRFRNGDTLLARITPCLENGKTARVSGLSEGETGHGSTEFIVLSAREHVTDSQFIYYVARSPHFRSYAIGQMTGTSGRQRVPIDAVKSFEMPLPPLAEQRAIADVLGALDDKIERNQQTARALERLARATFRAWFVDFEPVKTKAAGADAFPSMPQHIFDSLPTRFGDSEIGPVPEGWEVKTISECISLTMGQSPPSEFYNESGEGLPFHQGVTDYGFRFPTHRVYCTTEGRIAESQDVLLSVRAPVGRINVADRRLVLGRGLAGLRHRSGRQSFLLQQLCHAFAEEDAVGDGTIYKAVTKRFLEQMPLLTPSELAQDAFENLARPLDDLIAACEVESRKLAAARDLLLPVLVNGQIRVEVADD